MMKNIISHYWARQKKLKTSNIVRAFISLIPPIKNTSTETEQANSTISGANVDLQANKDDVTFAGSDLKTTAGNASITGDNVAFVSTENKNKRTTQIPLFQGF